MDYRNIDPEEFDRLRKEENSVVLDVRPENELVEGEIEGHITINFFDADFADQVAELEKDKTYLIYCRSGNRSGKACRIMAELGFQKLYNLDGGIRAWNIYSVGF